MEDEYKEIKQKAIRFARANKKSIALKITDPEQFLPELNPTSVYMAGSPGAGKTEVSIALLDVINQNMGPLNILRIDPDELRSNFEDYSGNNAWLFQPAISILVSAILDLAFKQSQSFILDGTLSNFRIADENISRSLKRKRYIQLLYVYLNPEKSWEFVRARAKIESRAIPPERFVEQYFTVRQNVNRLKQKYGTEINVDILSKDIDGAYRFYKAGIDCIDHHIPEKYSKADIEDFVASGVRE